MVWQPPKPLAKVPQPLVWGSMVEDFRNLQQDHIMDKQEETYAPDLVELSVTHL